MYQQAKNWLKRLVPKHLLYRYEPLFRSFVALFYAGDQYQCNICEQQLGRFVTLDNGDQLCPRCGSLPRDRRLWALLLSEFLRKGSVVLDFSPSRCLYRRLKAHPDIVYYSSDLSGDFLADHHYDITHIDAAPDLFDLVVCYHILEHIPDDRKAMRELFRVLRPGGVALIQTPFKEGEIYEDRSISAPEDRLRHFGQEDHVRIYSVDGLRDRLVEAGFDVELQRIRTKTANRNGFAEEEILLLAIVPKRGGTYYKKI